VPVAALTPAQLLQTLLKCPNSILRFRVIRGQSHEHADAPHALALLRPRDKWSSRHRTAEERDEFAPSH
jgi:hypothetical protein